MGRKPKHREPHIVADGPACPRCGERVSIILLHKSTSGVRRYRCFSERCKSEGINRGRGRGFVIVPK